MKILNLIIILSLLSLSSAAQKIDVISNEPGERLIKATSSVAAAQAWSVYGEAQGFNGHGVVGIATGDEGRGVYGHGAIGIYGSASNGNALAGYFGGNVQISGLNKGLIFPDATKQITAFKDHDIFYRRETVHLLVKNSSLTGAECLCVSGDVAVGGGWESLRVQVPHVHDASVHAYYNRPINGGWEVGIRNDSNNDHVLTVFVICANVN